MQLKKIIIFSGFFLLLTTVRAQRLELMQPVGYQTPFLKSGEFISNLYYFSMQSKMERTNYITKSGEYNINFTGYLGLTDNLVLRTHISAFPGQKISRYTKGSKGNDRIDFYIDPEITISYRPIRYLEIFGSFQYTQYEITRGPYYDYMTFVEIDPETGIATYNERLAVTRDEAVSDISTYRVRFGLTYAGGLW